MDLFKADSHCANCSAIAVLRLGHKVFLLRLALSFTGKTLGGKIRLAI